MTTCQILILSLVISALVLESQTEKIWGNKGSDFEVGGDRLIDYSYAGYNAGETPLGNLRVTHSVKDFGAVADGKTDNSRAFQRAITSVPEGSVLHIPAGKYHFTAPITVQQKRVSLKGDGSDKTILTYKHSRQTGDFLINYNGGEFINQRSLLGTISNPLPKRGDNVITMSSNLKLAVGDWVVIVQGAPKTLRPGFLPMNFGVDPGCVDLNFCFKSDNMFRHATRVAAVNGNKLTIERPLPWDMWANFAPHTIHSLQSRLKDVAVEGLALEMMSPRYAGHFKETGYGGITFYQVVNGWIRDLKVTDSDFAVQLRGSLFVTVTDVVLNANPERLSTLGHCGHAGVGASSKDCLIKNVRVNTRFVHDLTVDKGSHGNVFSDCSGIDLNMDHHKAQNYATLWTNIDVGRGLRVLQSGGAGPRGFEGGPLTTFWNVYSKTSTALSSGEKVEKLSAFGVNVNFISFPASVLAPRRETKFTKTWLIDQSDVKNLYEEMKAVRMSSPGKVSALLGGKGNGGKLVSQA